MKMDKLIVHGTEINMRCAQYLQHISTIFVAIFSIIFRFFRCIFGYAFQ